MGNLGDYQWITTLAKKVGDPITLIGLIVVLSVIFWPIAIPAFVIFYIKHKLG